MKLSMVLANEKLPVIFVIQDNRFGISVPKKDQTANLRATDNFRGFKNLKIFHCDGKNVFDAMNTMTEAKAWVEKNQMPAIVHATVVRIGSHSNSDDHQLYRDKDELHCVKAADPLLRFHKVMVAAGRFTEEELDKIQEEVKTVVYKAHKAASYLLRIQRRNLFSILCYLNLIYQRNILKGSTTNRDLKKKFIAALNETLKAEFRHNPDTYIWGQDVAHKEKGGIFNVTKGLQQEFGQERVFNAPIAEDFIVGTANGMSRFNEKIRIVIEGAEFADYFWPAMEQFVEMTHEYWRTNGKFSPNVTIRLASGGYIGGGLYHSQTTEGALTTFPGIRVVYPSFADDAAGLLRTSMRSNGPTLFLEPKALYNDPRAEAVVPDDFEVPFGSARIRREGNNLTIITYGNTTHMCLEAAEKLATETGKQTEVIDLRSLIPLDKEAILNSVKKTNKALVVHEDKVFGGFGGELAGLIADEAFQYLDAPVKRVGSIFTPVGFNRILEKAILPNTEKIYSAARMLVEY